MTADNVAEGQELQIDNVRFVDCRHQKRWQLQLKQVPDYIGPVFAKQASVSLGQALTGKEWQGESSVSLFL